MDLPHQEVHGGLVWSQTLQLVKLLQSSFILAQGGEDLERGDGATDLNLSDSEDGKHFDNTFHLLHMYHKYGRVYCVPS